MYEAHRSLDFRRYVTEAIGTFALVAVGPGAVMVSASTPALSLGRSFAVELGYSGVLAFVIMGVATDERTPAGVAPFALGVTVFAGALVTGPLTGGSFNPARSFGPALAGGPWTAHWIYWLAPIAGMVAAMHVYELLRPAAAPTVPRGVLVGVEGPLTESSGTRPPLAP
jgi:aquaporin Z